MTLKDIEYLMRKETREERGGLPAPTQLEEQQAWILLPNTPLHQTDALKYGALMFALGRRQITLEWEGWFRRHKHQLAKLDINDTVHCCEHERRDMRGGCTYCGDPAL